MISMNVPKHLWGQAVLTAAYLINRILFKVLEWKTPCEMLKGENVCILPIERKLFVSMDFTFRELEPYYSSDVTSPFNDSLDTSDIRRERENSGGEIQVTVGSIPCSCLVGESDEHELEDENQEEENKTQGELRVYRRRRKQNEGQQNEGHMPVPAEIDVSQSPLSWPVSTLEAPTSPFTDTFDSGGMIPHSSPSIALRQTSHSNTGNPPDRYGFPYNIAHFVSYSNISPMYRAFIASLDMVSIPKCWQVVKEDPKWRAVMLEEFEALDKNET